MFSIYDRLISAYEPPLIIAELGINHSGEFAVAKTLVDSARRAGAEIIKHQTHIPDSEMSADAHNIQPDNADVSIHEVISRNALSAEEELELKNYVESRGLIFISTPFSLAAVDRLIELDVPAFKIGSGECNNIPLLEKVAATGKPVILSTGMNSIDSIRPAVQVLETGHCAYALLHCTNIYPTPYDQVRLLCLNELRDAFPNAVVGLSDHTGDIYTSIAAIALGARIIELHYTDHKEREGPDISASVDEKQFRELITASRNLQQSLKGGKGIVQSEINVAKFAFASVTSMQEIEAGAQITPENVTVKRPGTGIPAAEIAATYGRIAKVNIKPNSTITDDMLE